MGSRLDPSNPNIVNMKVCTVLNLFLRKILREIPHYQLNNIDPATPCTFQCRSSHHECSSVSPHLTLLQVTHNIDVPIVGQSLEPGSRISDYMTLPVSQFVLVDLPMGARMDRLDDRGTFRLVIPRLELLNLWLEPSFEVMVQLKEVDGERVCAAQRSSVNHRIGSSDCPAFYDH